MNFIVYEKDTGRITSIVSGVCVSASEMEKNISHYQNRKFIAGEADPERQYICVKTLDILNREEMPFYFDGTRMVVPSNTRFFLYGATEVSGVTDASGVLEFQFEEPGSYFLDLFCFPFLSKKVEIHVDSSLQVSFV
ncbi:hypothetical protein [Ectothiorhodospira shaposhnikovii]|uniref:hypothetical protein n=1 Tax=Ectothiorhodospira shaposhnikovii TaxID=1054 RepID=UPI001EE8BF2B|nr:hypothetical protein [Ectothiorhodospira shaposhnikovii]MCG5512867.1 hypothetical protein [Ectothiorhodospira shaposhnikovii]